MMEKIKAAKIYFALPSYDSRVDVNFLYSMMNTQNLLFHYGTENRLGIVQGDCYVARARNNLVSQFLKTDFTHLFFIDSDMGWDAESVVKLIAHDKDFICGAYQTKNDKTPKTYAIDPMMDGNEWKRDGGLIRLRGAATGFMCIKRSVFEKMIPNYPDIAYMNLSGEMEHAFFHCSIRKLRNMDHPLWYGEDIDFSHKWIAMGGEIFCDPDMAFTHAGYKAYKCHLSTDMASGVGTI